MDPEVPRPGRIYQVAAEHRRSLLAGEREAAARMVRAYGEAWRRINHELEHITRRIEEARRAGEEVRASWLFRQRRWQALNEQVLAEVQRFERQVEESVRAQQAEVVAAAQEHAEEQARAVAGGNVARVTTTWNRLPVEATEDLVGILSDGSPLRTLLDGLGEETSAGVQRALLTGLMTGQNPRRIARLVRQAFGVPLTRALTISRTEVLRAYRESTRRTYQENRHLIRGWQWLAAHQPRTCAMCLAMDGSIHSLDEQLVDHPNGRCAMTPVLVDEEPPARETGEQWLERQKPDVQERVLGKAGAAAYREGAVTLQDFVGRRRSEEWGTTRYAKSLREILGPEEALKWRREAMVRAKAVSESLRPARFVGAARGRFGELLEERSGTRVVRVVPAVVEHYRKHAGQFDLRRAEALLSTVLADPLMVVHGKKATTLVAVGEYDADHYLVVPVKSLPGENWLETLFIEDKQRFMRRRWVEAGTIFK